MACTKMFGIHKDIWRGVHRCLQAMGLKRKESSSVALLVLEVKDGLDRTGMKKTDKNSKNFMHWNVAPDALPGSATVGPLA